MISVDARESDRILKALQKDTDSKKEFREVGDYELDGGYAIEHKDWDLLQSIISHRIFDQLNNLCNYEHPILAYNLENLWQMFYFSQSRYVHKQYLGLLATLVVKYPNLKIVPYLGEDQFIDFVKTLDKKIHEGDRVIPRPAPFMRKTSSLKEDKENCLTGIKGVSIGKSKKLLDYFGSIKAICNASEEELREVESIGPKLAKNIWETLN